MLYLYWTASLSCFKFCKCKEQMMSCLLSCKYRLASLRCIARLLDAAEKWPHPEWNIQNRPRRERTVQSVLWHAYWRRRLDCLSEKARWLSRLLWGMGRLQSRVWSADWWVLAGKWKDPPTDSLYTQLPKSWHGGLEQGQSVCQVWPV